MKNAFDVSQPAQDAARASLGEEREIARRAAETRVGRERLFAGLVELGLQPLPAVANFVSVVRRRRQRGGLLARAARRDRQAARRLRRSVLGPHHVGLPDEIELALRLLAARARPGADPAAVLSCTFLRNTADSDGVPRRGRPVPSLEPGPIACSL